MSFSNEDDHHIENIKKATGFDKYTVLIRHCMTATWKCLTSCVMEEINKQQRFFLSEYHLQEINSREIYPHSTFSSKRNNNCFFSMRMSNVGKFPWSWFLGDGTQKEKIVIIAPKFEKMQIHFRDLHRVLNSWKSLEICPAIFQTW